MVVSENEQLKWQRQYWREKKITWWICGIFSSLGSNLKIHMIYNWKHATCVANSCEKPVILYNTNVLTWSICGIFHDLTVIWRFTWYVTESMRLVWQIVVKNLKSCNAQTFWHGIFVECFYHLRVIWRVTWYIIEIMRLVW